MYISEVSQLPQHRINAIEQQMPNKRMKHSSNKRRVQFQVEFETHEHERLPQHEAVRLWYCSDELKAIHKEIFVSLMESKNGNLSNFEFSARGLEEIRKRKPHKRQVRREEYLTNVIALYKKQRKVGAVCPLEIQRFAMPHSRSAKLRAQHYATLDADEARAVYQETFGITAAKETEGVCGVSRRVPLPSAVSHRSSQESIARSA